MFGKAFRDLKGLKELPKKFKLDDYEEKQMRDMNVDVLMYYKQCNTRTYTHVTDAITKGTLAGHGKLQIDPCEYLNTSEWAGFEVEDLEDIIDKYDNTINKLKRKNMETETEIVQASKKVKQIDNARKYTKLMSKLQGKMKKDVESLNLSYEDLSNWSGWSAFHWKTRHIQMFIQIMDDVDLME